QGPHFPTAEREAAEVPAPADQWHVQQRPPSLLLDVGAPERLSPTVRLGLAHVEDLGRLPRAARPKERPPVPQRFLPQDPGFRSSPADLDGPEQLVAPL